MRRHRRGLALALIVLLLPVLMVVVMSGLGRSRQLVRSVAWEGERTALRLLVESAVEELSLGLQEAIVDPSHPAYPALLTGGEGSAVRVFPPDAVLDELARQVTERGGAFDLDHSVTILRRSGVSDDPDESAGVLRIHARIRRTGDRLDLLEEVYSERQFRIARTGIPGDLRGVSVLVLEPDADAFEHMGGRSVYAQAGGSSSRLLELMTEPAPVGFQYTDPALARGAVSSFEPWAIGQRAHLEFPSVADFMSYLGDHLARGRPLDGVLHVADTEPLFLSFEGFRGKALISSDGPVIVGNVRVVSLGEDELVIGSAERVVVQGSQVQASLVAVSGQGVVLTRPAQVEGHVFSRVFPMPFQMSAQELGDTRVAPPGAFTATGSLGELHGMFSPDTLYLVHEAPASVTE